MGRYQTEFITQMNASDVYVITADQFDTSVLDDDDDCVSNLDELIAGTDPLSTEMGPAFDLRDDSEFFIRSIAGYQLDRFARNIEDLAFIVEQQTTVVWPDDSYYEVQTAATSTLNGDGSLPDTTGTVCDGGAECKIVPGTYVLINHTLDQRSLLTVPVISRDDQANALLLPDEIISLVERPISPRFDAEYAITLTTQRTHYECEGGGSMIKELSDSISLYDLQGNQVGGIRREGYMFDQCRMVVRNRLLPDGAYLINGSLETEDKNNYGSGQLEYHYDGFSLVDDTGLQYQVQAAVEYVDGYDWQYRRIVSIDEYQLTLPSGEIAERISDTRFSYRDMILPTTFSVVGNIQNTRTSGQQVTIRTDPVFVRDYNPGTPDSPNPVSGTIELRANDGSVIYISADPVIGSSDPLWDLTTTTDFTSETGEQFVEAGIKYDLSFDSWDVDCVPGDTTGREIPEYTASICSDEFLEIE